MTIRAVVRDAAHAGVRQLDSVGQTAFSTVMDWLEDQRIPIDDILAGVESRHRVRPFETAVAHARLAMREYGTSSSRRRVDRVNRGEQLLIWAAAAEALARVHRTETWAYTVTAIDQQPIDQLMHQADLLRALAETERARYTEEVIAVRTHRTPAVETIESVAGPQLDRLCRADLSVGARNAVLADLERLLRPRIGATVEVLHDLT